MTIREIIKITRGKLLCGNPDVDVKAHKICTDSRLIEQGDLFIALSGVNFDGNDFTGRAFLKGAIGAIVTRQSEPAEIYRGKIVIKVDDATRALQDVARYHRMLFKIPIIAVTGSNGKTTVKEMIWHILSARYKVLKNEGTKNNHVGVPQTLLKLNGRHEICALEMGANHAGEIRRLSSIARPNIAVITNIGQSHLEFLGDTNGVYKAKAEILEYLDKKSGVLVINGDDKLLSGIKDKRFRTIRFGFNASNDLIAGGISIVKNKIRFTVNKKNKFELNLLGVHNISNALAAIGVARQLGLNYDIIRKRLRGFRPAYMRLDMKNIKGIDIINDAYNSNPSSMKCALEAIKHCPDGSRWVVSGDMLELGKESARLHRLIGEAAAKSGIQGLLAIGKHSRHTLTGAKKAGMSKNSLWHCSSHEEIADVLKRVAKKGDIVLVKGSRGMKMEEVLNKL